MKHRRLTAGTCLLVCAVVGTALVGTSTSYAITPTAVSTPSAPGGWANGGETSPTYVADPAGGDGTGALLFATPGASDHVDYYKQVNVPLQGVSGLTYTMENTGGPQASYQLEICAGGITAGPPATCNGFSTLVYEPYQNGGTLVGDGTWHTFSGLEGATFWSTHPIPGDPTSSGANQVQVPLSAITSANPNAVVFAYGISQGSNNPGSTSYVDDVGFNGALTNFELAVNPTITTNPNLTVYQTTPAGTPVFYTNPTATDPNGGTASVTCSPASGSVFPVGTTTVTCTASETEGLTATSTFTVRVLRIVTACEGLPYTDKGYLTAHPNYGANTPTTPCVTSTYTQVPLTITLIPGIPLLHIPATGVSLGVLHGVSELAALPGVVSTSANSTIASVSVSALGLTLSAHALYSQASATLSGGLCNDEITTGLSDIANLTINGKSIVVGTGPISIKTGLINIYVNQTVKVGNTVTQRALVINLGGDPANDIVIGQAVAGVACAGS